MKIRSINGQVDIKHLLKQVDRGEIRWRKMLDSGKYQGTVREIIVEQLENLEKLRARFLKAEGDGENDPRTN